MKELQERHERVDKRDLQIAKKRESISLKYLLGLIFGAMLHWMGRKKEEVGRVLGGNGHGREYSPSSGLSEVG